MDDNNHFTPAPEKKYVVTLFLEHGVQNQFLADGGVLDGLQKAMARKPGRRSVFRMSVPDDVRSRTLIIDLNRVLSMEAVDQQYSGNNANSN